MPARADQTTDPDLQRRLLLARRGQAYFSRALAGLADDEFGEPSLLDGWSRAHVVGHVGLNARALTRLVGWASTGIETPMYASPTQRGYEIDFAATLPAQALRTLSDHAAIHLSVEWRDLSDTSWGTEVTTAQGRTVPVSETVWMRTREVWIHAVDLANGGSFDDFPPEFVDALIDDVVASWARRRHAEHFPHVVLSSTDRPGLWGSADAPAGALDVHGRAADLARWVTGRGASGVAILGDEAPVPRAPRWL